MYRRGCHFYKFMIRDYYKGMEAYLASRAMKDANNFFINLNFEILNGCKFKCKGCHVEINAQKPLVSEEVQNIEKLIINMKAEKYSPFIAFIGPTDFLVADNFEAYFDDQLFRSLLRQFKRISLQTTYQDMGNSYARAKTLSEFSDKEIEVNIIIDPNKVMDDSYMARMKKNKEKFIHDLGRTDIKTYGVMNVFNYDETNNPEILKDYHHVHSRLSGLFETTIDFNFSAGRNPDLSDEEFLSLTSRIKNLYNNSVISNDENTHEIINDSSLEKQYNYRGGDLFYSPLLYERFVSFRDQFKISLANYTVQEVEDYERKVQLSQYEAAPKMDECSNCSLLPVCVDRGILRLMSAYNVTSCVVAKKATSAVRNMGALPVK